jgi:exodeoxyribonuclease VII large subunit
MTDRVLSVKEITSILKAKFDTHINGFYTIEGEVTNLTDKGHCYFSLKDKKENTVIRCILWRGTKEKHGYTLNDGDFITVSGKIGLYEVQNSYSFSVFKMKTKETIETEYKRKYEMFKKKGYFNKRNILNKRKIKSIGLITSLQGQAINDFKKTLNGRFFCGKVYLYGVKVQGVNCAKDVIKALKFFEKNKQFNVDIIMMTRGGGSQLDMDEFNNEKMVEQVYKCKKPVYCAIGHEKDMCLMDYVCDLRSSTPTSLALEISEDYNKINNKISMILENEKSLFEKKRNDIIFKVNEKKSSLYQKLTEHRPNGFYFDNKFISNIEDFQKLCNEKFNVHLEDGIIEFKINNHKVVEKFNKKYTYQKYVDLYNDVYSTIVSEAESKKFEKYFEQFKKLENQGKFGKKEHYDSFKKLMTLISFYIREFKSLDKITRKKENFELKNTNDYNSLFQYKKHLNYLEDLLEDDFKGFKIRKIAGDNNELYRTYLNYNNKEGMTTDIIQLYLNVKKMKAKYLKLKI